MTLYGGEWASFSIDEHAKDLVWVFKIQKDHQPKIGFFKLSKEFFKEIHEFMVGDITKSLNKFEGDLPLEEKVSTFGSWIVPVQVHLIIRGPKKTSFDLYYGKLDQLTFDPQE